jgi:hypothetical protein
MVSNLSYSRLLLISRAVRQDGGSVVMYLSYLPGYIVIPRAPRHGKSASNGSLALGERKRRGMESWVGTGRVGGAGRIGAGRVVRR